MEKPVEEKLYRCCNTCKHKASNFYGCNIPKECFNGFSAYESNEEMVKQENNNI